MRFSSAFAVLRCRFRRRPSVCFSPRRCFSSSVPPRPSFGIAFDIDGVIFRGQTPIDGAPEALRRLYSDYGGGVRESKRAKDLSAQLGINILHQQVLQGHTPFKDLVNRFENGLVIAVGKGEPADVMLEYGFKNVLSIDEYASYFDGIDPLSPYKTWKTRSPIDKGETGPCEPPHTRNVFPERVEAAFVVSDPVDWGRDIQVLCDVLRSGGLPGREISHQPPLFFANNDLEYQAVFPTNRLGMGAYLIALESIFNRIHDNALKYTCFGKPNPSVFRNAEKILSRLPCRSDVEPFKGNGNGAGSHLFQTIYMVGDNPAVDINGARQAGHPWFSILTRTGVFKGKENDPQFPADLVVDTVGDAVDYILRREGLARP
ncbi:unnamed protein product [Victoria cruziana]